MLAHLSRDQPHHRRNLPRVCSFFAKGQCNRGKECPYRHDEATEETDASRQNIRDRYYGVNDPVAQRLLTGRAAKATKLTPPDDPQIMTLYLGGIKPDVTKQDIT
jgi:pre-mRNA-splicing factor RBM22/SLT11